MICKKEEYSFTIDKRDYQLKIEGRSAAMAGAEGNFEVSKADIGSALASILFLMPTCNQRQY
jgi:membrane fusion protein (multidrug efflux system)